MTIYILDPDTYYQDLLSRKLRRFFTSHRIHTFSTPQELMNLPCTQDDVILLYCPELYPQFKPTLPYLELHEVDWLDEALTQSQDILLRSGRISCLTHALQNHIRMTRPPQIDLPSVTTIISKGFLKLCQHELITRIDELYRQGVQPFLLRLGPAVLFTQSSNTALNASRCLLELEHHDPKHQTFKLGQYLEVWPPYPACFCLSAPANCDDLLLMPPETLRILLLTYIEWCNHAYNKHWRLFILSYCLPQRLNIVLSALTEELYSLLPNEKVSSSLEQSEHSQLIAQLPGGAIHKEIYVPDNAPTAVHP